MNRSRIRRSLIQHHVVLCLLVCVGALAAAGADDESAFQAARTLEQQGQVKEAFLKFLAIPGGEHAAATLVRGAPQEFLATLRNTPGLLDSPRVRLVEADLVLATGQRDEAKRLYQVLAATAAQTNWGSSQAGYYPAEPPQSYGDDQNFQSFARAQLGKPYTYGPGSHRDNWLLRRLLALVLNAEAGKELERIWNVHRANSQPYIEVAPHYNGQGHIAGDEKHLVRPSGFNSYGLQFALDYGFFLRRSGRTNEALAVLLEPIRVMDMDRNPNLVHHEPLPASTNGLPLRAAEVSFGWFGFGRGTAGVSRKEYLRLVYGEFKSVGRENAMVAELQKAVDAGDNRVRRVLAQLRLHQGQTDSALALELDYIAHGDFDTLTSTYRRGLVFEEYRKTTEAVAEFEKALDFKPAPMRLPDYEERISETPYSQQAALFPGQFDSSVGEELNPTEVRDRLARLYSSLGQADKALEMKLSQFDNDERRLENLGTIEQLAGRFNAANQEARFNDWARARLAAAKTPLVRANLAWQLRDYVAAMTNAAVASTSGYYSWQPWQERFARLGRDQERQFMQALVKATPQDAVARLTLLDLEDRLEGPEAIAALELLLATDAQLAFPRGKGAWNRTQFRNYLDLAYRLIRLYEKNNQLDNLRALGLRIAKGEKPFESYDQNLYWSLSETSMDDLGNACLALAVQYADSRPYQEQLLAALKTSRWTGAQAQLARRTGLASGSTSLGGANTNLATPAWANLPDGVQIFASHDHITTLARDDQFVYAGTRWGLTIYDFRGSPVARLALGAVPQTMVVTQQQVWLGTSGGLFRIQPTASSQPGASAWTVAFTPAGNITALALDDDLLWVGMHGQFKTLDRRTLEMRSVSTEELKRPIGTVSRIVLDGDYVWTDGDAGLLRYNRTAGSWSAPSNPGPRDPPRLLAIIDGQVWADVYLDDELRHRPARVDRKTLKLTPLTIGGNLTRDQRLINETFSYAGKHQGQLVFRGGWRWFSVEGTNSQLRALPEDYTNSKQHISDPLPDGLPLPGGGRALISGDAGSLNYVRPDRTSWSVSAGAWPDGLRAGYRASAWADNWPGGAVWAVVFDDANRQDWLCTGSGLSALNQGERLLEHFGTNEGVNYGPMLEGLEFHGKLYFATGWEDARGGLTVYDPGTRVFTTFFRSDGMDTDKVIGLEAKGDQIELRFAIEYLRYGNTGDRNYRLCPPCLFDPVTRRFSPSGQPELLTQIEATSRATRTNASWMGGMLLRTSPVSYYGDPGKMSLGPMPFLGGGVTRSYQHDGRIWLCGDCGLVVLPSWEVTNRMAFATLMVKPIPSLDETLREEARRVSIPRPITLELLRTLATNRNRYVRADALAAAMTPALDSREGFEPIIASCVRDSYLNVRATAVWLLSRMKSESRLAALRAALDDSDEYIRIVAAIALAHAGQHPPLELFEPALMPRHEFGNYPFGANSTIGVEAGKLGVYAALAVNSDRETFELLMKYPLEPSGYDEYPKVLAALGAALRKHQDAADLLLQAYDPEQTYAGQVQFAQLVFASAGKEMLPVLHRGLASKDRVVRSNAARACGRIGDPSSIPYLLSALDLESGLARASIVWALGELKASEAVPMLIDLYADARDAEHNRRAGAGFLAQQAAAESRAQYTALRNLNAIGSDWDELKAAATPKTVNPRREEQLLTAELVLEAVHKLGPAAQGFYRSLAGAREVAEREEAAVALGEAQGNDVEKNLPILKSLRGDSNPDVQVRALVSLLRLGDRSAEPELRNRLANGDESQQGAVLAQMDRLESKQLEFARKEIEAMARNDRLPRFLHERASALASKLALIENPVN